MSGIRARFYETVPETTGGEGQALPYDAKEVFQEQWWLSSRRERSAGAGTGETVEPFGELLAGAPKARLPRRREATLEFPPDGDPLGRRHSPSPRGDRRAERRRQDFSRGSSRLAVPRNEYP